MLSQSTLIKICVEQARLSDNRHRLGAVIYRKNTLLSCDHNYSMKSAKNLHPRFQAWPNSVHAEMATVLSARCNLSGASIFIIRINRREEFLLSKPCKYCILYLRHVKIKNIIYSTEEGFKEIRL